jgi:hypothetical protein
VLHIAVRWQLAESRQIKQPAAPGFGLSLALTSRGRDGFGSKKAKNLNFKIISRF